MRRALEAFIVEGIDTSVPLHQRILADPDFAEGRLSTKFMERFIPARPGGKGRAQEAALSITE
jgi:acetyl-CoA carboxylase biotin carboxylase subunit